ncbi:hypothetical protein RRG08_005945 [Elysia crispata]|uniref:Uncharacterized protein n=1 Tax=Elysia crispata TaxID=231223 RepID=A0AAE0ZJF6_9GAST|nr:hypothetical protein RRG08_005945 [Elysia crispata]
MRKSRLCPYKDISTFPAVYSNEYMIVVSMSHADHTHDKLHSLTSGQWSLQALMTMMFADKPAPLQVLDNPSDRTANEDNTRCPFSVGSRAFRIRMIVSSSAQRDWTLDAWAGQRTPVDIRTLGFLRTD